MDVRIVDKCQNQGPIYEANVYHGVNYNALRVVLVNPSGDVSWPIAGSGGAGGDGAILDGANASIKATVKQYTNSNPQAVVLVNASGDAYNGNQTSVVVNKWNLTPSQDSVNVDGGRTGVTGDVSTIPKVGSTWPVSIAGTVNVSGSTSANPVGVSGDVTTVPKPGQTWPVSFGGTVGAYIVGGSGGGTFGISGDVTTVPKAGQTWPVREQGTIGIQVVGGSVGAQVAPSGDFPVRLAISSTPLGISGDVSTKPAAGQTWPVSIAGTVPVTPQGVYGVYIVGGSGQGTAGVTGDVAVKPATTIAGSYHPISGDTGIRDGANPAIKGTVRQYTRSNPVAVSLTNSSGDTINPVPKAPVILTASGRTAAGSNAVVAAVPGKKIKMTGYELQSEGDNARGYFASGASGTQLTTEWEFANREGTQKAVSGVGGGYLKATTAGAALSFESSSARVMKYSVDYYTEDDI